MFKKIVIAMMLIAPVCVFAQSFKFGHVHAQEIAVLLPDYKEAQTTLQALDKQLSDEMKRTSDEITRKYQEYQTAMQSTEKLPENIQQRRVQEINEMQEKAEQFQQDAYQQMQTKQQELIAPILKKVEDAIKAVGQAEGYTYIFDLTRTYIPFVNESQSTDLTAKVKAKLGIK